MQPPAIPADETERLAALRQLELLDTPPEERFDRITRLARRLFDVAASSVTLIDAERQWFKSTCGFRNIQGPRDASFCAHAILNERILVIPDARADPRFADNPAVVGEPGVIFYAGRPLHGPGRRIVGALCVTDNRPRAFDEADRRALDDLGAVVERELNLEEAYNTQHRRLRLAREAAEQASRAKSAFLANMSHDLRTPLNAIIGYSEMLIEDADSTTKPDLQMILASGERLLGMLDRLLDFSRIEANKLTLCPEEFHVADIVAELADAAQPLAARHANTLHCDCQTSDCLRGDAPKMRQVLFQLLDNACKFTRAGSVTLRASRGQAPAGETPGGAALVFEVSDTGMGMEKSQLDRLFEPAGPGDEARTRGHGGPGFGLAVSRKLCDLMEGEISARSLPGQGSVFTVRLPVESVR